MNVVGRPIRFRAVPKRPEPPTPIAALGASQPPYLVNRFGRAPLAVTGLPRDLDHVPAGRLARRRRSGTEPESLLCHERLSESAVL